MDEFNDGINDLVFGMAEMPVTEKIKNLEAAIYQLRVMNRARIAEIAALNVKIKRAGAVMAQQ